MIKTGEYPVLEKLRRMKPGSKEARRFAQEIVRSTGLVKAERGRHGGTWLHPELAVEFARWLDKKFAIWCNRRVRELLSGQTVTLSGPVEFDVRVMFASIEQVLTAPGQSVMEVCNRLSALVDDHKRFGSLCGKGMAVWKVVRKQHTRTIKRVCLCLRLNSPQATRQRSDPPVSCVDWGECLLP